MVFAGDDNGEFANTGFQTGIRDGLFEIDNNCTYDHFLAFTHEEIERFKAAGATIK